MEHVLAPPEFDESAFSGVVRLFPLPGVSLLPGIVLPLHVYEERYRALVADALDSDGLIAMAVLEPGWEADYAGRPPLERAVCLGQIVTYHRLDDGRYNLYLAGLRRALLVSEVEPPEAFRRAHVEVLGETLGAQSPKQIEELKQRFTAAFRDSLPVGSLPVALERVFDHGAPLGLLTDLAAYSLPLANPLKTLLLAEPDASRRAALMLEVLEAEGPAKPLEERFPPSLDSEN